MVVALFGFSVASVLVFMGKVSGSEWQIVTGLTIGAYIVGQAYVDGRNS